MFLPECLFLAENREKHTSGAFTGCGKTHSLVTVTDFWADLIYPMSMRGDDQRQTAMFSYLTLAQRIAADHPARQIRVLVDRALLRMDGELEKLYADRGRPSIAPERLLRATLLMILYSIRSERQLMEQMNYNLLFRWFVGLEMDDAVWDVTVFTKNRERLIWGAVSQRLLESVLVEAREHHLLSEEHFTVDGTLIQAWAAARSFKEKSDPPKPGAGSGYKGEVLLRDKVESTTDPEARLYKKATADKAVPSYQGHALTENRNGLVVAAEATLSAADAEVAAALTLLDRTIPAAGQRQAQQEITPGADTGYQEKEFLNALRKREVAPHVSEYVKGNLGRNSLTEAERGDERRAISQRKRKLIERVFGWSKLDRPLRQIKLRGLDRVDWFYRLTIVAHNMVRMRRLIPVESLAQ
jgi:transposase